MDATISQLAQSLLNQVSNIIDPDTTMNPIEIFHLSQSLEILSKLTGTPSANKVMGATNPTPASQNLGGLIKIGSYHYEIGVSPNHINFRRYMRGVWVTTETLDLETNLCTCKYGKKDCCHKKWLAANPQVLEKVVVCTVDTKIEQVEQTIAATPNEAQEWVDEYNERPLSVAEREEREDAIATDELYQAVAEETGDATTITPPSDEESECLTDETDELEITEDTPGVMTVTQEITPEQLAQAREDINGIPWGTSKKSTAISEVKKVDVIEEDGTDDNNVPLTPTVTKSWNQIDQLKKVTTLIGKNLIVTHSDVRLYCVVTQDSLCFTDETFGINESFEWDSFGEVKQMIKSQLDNKLFEAIKNEPSIDPAHPNLTSGEETGEDEDYEDDATDEDLEDYASWWPSAPSVPSIPFEQVVRQTLEGRVLRMGVPNPEGYTTQELAKIIKGDTVIEPPTDESSKSDPTHSDSPQLEVAPDSEPNTDPFGDFDF